MLKLLRGWLRVGVLEDGVTTATGAGTPQGSPVSPLLANIALHVLDQAWAQQGRSLGVLVRYCDDFVILCRTRQRAEQARRLVAEILATLGLHLHPDKTRIVELTRGRQGFDFLGFHHHKVESWRRRGRWYLQRWPADRAMNAIRAKIREATDRRFVGHGLAWIVGNLNRVLRRLLPPRQLRAEVRHDRQLRPRAPGHLRQHQARPPLPPQLVPPLHRGLVAGSGGLSPQRTSAERGCACASVNDVGKPCAGELHARFDRGPLADQAMVSRIEHRRGNPTG
jgi:hypothetical protein